MVKVGSNTIIRRNTLSSNLGIGPSYVSITVRKENLKNHITGIGKVQNGIYFIMDLSGNDDGQVYVKKESTAWQRVEITKIEGTMTGTIYTLSNNVLLYNKFGTRTYDGMQYKDLNLLADEETARKLGIDLV